MVLHIMCYYILLVIIGKFLGLYESIFIVFLNFPSKNYLMISYFTFKREQEGYT